MVHHQNLSGEAEGAGQDIEVPAGNAQLLTDAEAVQPPHRQGHPQPQGAGNLLPQDQPRQGHQNNVQRRNEARLAGGGGLQALLLEKAGHRQRRAAAQAPQNQIPAGPGGRLSPAPPPESPEAAQAKEEKEGDDRPGGVEGKGPHVFRAHALGHEGGAPNHGCNEGQDILSNSVDFHFPCSMFSSVIY